MVVFRVIGVDHITQNFEVPCRLRPAILFRGVFGKEVHLIDQLAEELGLTSFAVMSMMGDFEEEFGITVDESELTDIYTVKDIMNYIEKKQA